MEKNDEIGVKKGRKVELGAFWKNSMTKMWEDSIKKALTTQASKNLGSSVAKELKKPDKKK
jgi:hypothetical protein